MVFASSSVTIFISIILVLLAVLFITNIVRTYISDKTLFERIQISNKWNEKTKRFLFPMEAMDKIEVTFVCNVDGVDPEKAEALIKRINALKLRMKDRKFEVIVLITTENNRISKILDRYIRESSNFVKAFLSENDVVSDFVVAGIRARGNIISWIDYSDKMTSKLCSDKSPFVVLTAKHNTEPIPLYSVNDFCSIAYCSKSGFMTAFPKLHNYNKGMSSELISLCKHFHVKYSIIETDESCVYGLYDIYSTKIVDIYTMFLYALGIYKMDRSLKIKKD